MPPRPGFAVEGRGRGIRSPRRRPFTVPVRGSPGTVSCAVGGVYAGVVGAFHRGAVGKVVVAV